MQDLQSMINIALGSIIGLIGFLGGALYGNLKSQIKDGKDSHEKLNDRVTQLELLVAGKYPTREEFNKSNEALLDKLDSTNKALFAKLDEVKDEIHKCKLDNHNKHKTDE